MKLIQWRRGETTGLALLFGTGLIGGKIARELDRHAIEARDMPYDWSDRGQRTQERREILTAVSAVAPPGRVSVIWAAGRSGFGSSSQEMDAETLLLEELLQLANALAERLPEASHAFHLVSSSGGLFEGQRSCGADARPAPLRPYGDGKLAQENALIALAPKIHRRIYRPSSVYGFSRRGRAGLIPTLMVNTLKGRPSFIMGDLATLRDYVLAEDVGNFIASHVLSPGRNRMEVNLLAQARPASIFEVMRLVERSLGQRLILRVDAHPENARHMSFLPGATPRDWRPTALSVGISMTARLLRQHLATHDI